MKKGRTIRLTNYMGFGHIANPSNEGSADGWAREFGLARNASDVQYFPQIMSGGAAEKQHVEALKKKAAAEQQAKKNDGKGGEANTAPQTS